MLYPKKDLIAFYREYFNRMLSIYIIDIDVFWKNRCYLRQMSYDLKDIR